MSPCACASDIQWWTWTLKTVKIFVQSLLYYHKVWWYVGVPSIATFLRSRIDSFGKLIDHTWLYEILYSSFNSTPLTLTKLQVAGSIRLFIATVSPRCGEWSPATNITGHLLFQNKTKCYYSYMNANSWCFKNLHSNGYNSHTDNFQEYFIV